MPASFKAGLKMKIKEYLKISAICVILLALTILFFVKPPEHKISEYIFYTHLFYVPVILAAYWYNFHVFWVIVYIMLIMVIPGAIMGEYSFLSESFLTSLFFILPALIIIFLKKYYPPEKSEASVQEEGNKPDEFSSSNLIIEEQKRVIADMKEQLKEVYHRVKNNIQIVASLISLQIVKEKDENIKAALVECQNRVKTMSIIQEKIYSSENDNEINLKGIVESMVSSLMRAYKIDKEKVEIVIDIPEINVDVSKAIPLSQMINEILSNSLRHAFPGNMRGQVEIKLLQFECDRNFYSLCISDNGIGFPDQSFFPDKGKLGFYLISALAKQIGGKLELFLTSGTSFEFRFVLK